MSARDAARARFLAAAGWGGAAAHPLAGDASARRYLRLVRDGGGGGETAVLMDAPPEGGEDTGPFRAIAAHLRSLGLSAPAILAADAEAGFLLLEDLGDGLFARLAAGDAAREHALYAAAVDLLAGLHRHPPPAGLSRLDPATLGPMTGLAFTVYGPAAGAAAAPAAAPDAAAEIAREAAALGPAPEVLVLRDFHAENLLWLPGRAGPARVGLLDFQDAVTGHPAYDLVSLLDDARRDVPPALRAAMLARYAAAAHWAPAPDGLAAAAALLSAQRNLRIMGVFARLCLQAGKARYVDLMPRVWAHLGRALASPGLEPLRTIVETALPPPDDATRARLKARCRAPTP